MIVGMLILFMVFKVYVLVVNDVEFDCGCFGDILFVVVLKGWVGVYFNIGMLLVLLVDVWLMCMFKICFNIV